MMNKGRPNPFWHMMGWGISSGVILALSYIVVLLDFFGGFGAENPLSLLINPGAWWLAFIFGGVPGAVMGFFCALTLWGLLRNVSLPFTKVEMDEKRNSVYGSIFGLTLILSFLMISGFFGNIFDTLLLAIPPLIAAIAATYAAHRYMFRLKLWSGGIESRKSKAKNEALGRLSDQQSLRDDYAEHDSYQSEKRDSRR